MTDEDDRVQDSEATAVPDQTGTTYVVLLREVSSDPLWRELGEVTGGDRPTAWENAKRLFHKDMPKDVGQQGKAQLVPMRFWRTITTVVEQPPPQLRTEGL
jgi:hypothetical protein